MAVERVDSCSRPGQPPASDELGGPGLPPPVLDHRNGDRDERRHYDVERGHRRRNAVLIPTARRSVIDAATVGGTRISTTPDNHLGSGPHGRVPASAARSSCGRHRGPGVGRWSVDAAVRQVGTAKEEVTGEPAPHDHLGSGPRRMNGHVAELLEGVPVAIRRWMRSKVDRPRSCRPKETSRCIWNHFNSRPTRPLL